MRALRPRAAGVALLLAIAFPALSEPFDLPFAPAPGSRWLIEDANDIEINTGPAAAETQQIRQKGEIVFGQKSGDGYRATYTATEMSIEGSSPAVKIAGPAMQVMKGVTFSVVTDARGKPVEVENLDVARKTMGEMVDRIAASNDNPKVGDALRSLMAPLVNVSGATAAQTYAEPLNAMAAAQGTGIALDGSRTEREQRPNPFGGDPMLVTITTRVSQPDPEKRYTLVTRDEEYDKDGIKATALAMAKRLLRDVGAATSGDQQQEIDKLADAMKLSHTSYSVYTVQAGMTRTIRSRTSVELSAMGATFSKLDQRVFKISEAP